MKGMIFAAGIGSRLKPFTDRHPKAMVEIDGVPMLERVILNFIAAGIKDIVVNVHHFAGQIIKFIDNKSFGINIVVSDESDRLLDTGGGVAKAYDLLADSDNILLHNVDILTDIDLTKLINAHKSSPADVTLAVSKRKSSRQLYFDLNNRLIGWQNISTKEIRPDDFAPDSTMCKPLAFSGIHIISAKALQMLKDYSRDKDIFSIVPFYLDKCYDLDIRGHEIASEFQWYDIGKPETLEIARRNWSIK